MTTTTTPRNDDTNIEWTHWPGYRGASWNFLRGCSRVIVPGATTSGCGDSTGGGCYAERDGGRFCGPDEPYDGLVRITDKGNRRWTGEVRHLPDKVYLPLRRRSRNVWFVNSVSDLFHEKVLREVLDEAFAVMAIADEHVYIALTKRASRMREYVAHEDTPRRVAAAVRRIIQVGPIGRARVARASSIAHDVERGVLWPLPRLILGVSVEHQLAFDHRWPDLAATPAACRLISFEPLLGAVDVAPAMGALGWAIVGGESGARARLFDFAHARAIRDACAGAGVPFFLKQAGAAALDLDSGSLAPLDIRNSKGGDPAEWPADMRVRQLPTMASPS